MPPATKQSKASATGNWTEYQTPLDALYYAKLSLLRLMPDYHYVEQYRAWLNAPIGVFKDIKSVDPEMTYRKINDWDENHLIDSERQKDGSGWRRFSMVQIVQLQIIRDLKQLGFSSDRIIAVFRNILRCKTASGQEFEPLAYFIFRVLYHEKIVLMIGQRGNAYFWTEQIFATLFLEENAEPCVVLPFYSYVQASTKVKYKLDTTIENFVSRTHSEEEHRVLEVIRRDRGGGVVVKNRNGMYHVQVKTQQQDNLTVADVVKAVQSEPFQTVTVVVKEGTPVVLTREVSRIT